MSAPTPVLAGLAAAVFLGAGWGGAAVARPAQVVAAPSVSEAAQGFEGAQGTYAGVEPKRILDTRTGNGAPKAPVGAGGEVSLVVAGRGGVPGGVSAVVLNLTAVAPSTNTYLTAYPSGSTRPSTSSLNVVARANRANMVTVPVGSDGRVRIYNSTGTTHVLADVMGYYHGQVAPSTGAGSQYYTLDPERWFDSRSAGGALAPGEDVTVWADFGLDAPTVAALATNITVLDGSQPGFVSAGTAFSHEAPTFSTVNYGSRQVIANMSIGSVSVSGTEVGFSVKNGGRGSVQVIVDVVGMYVTGEPEGLRFRALPPQRIIDTRSGVGGSAQPLGANESRLHAAPTAVADVNTYALVTNMTVASPTSTTYVTAYDNDLTKPGVSNVNASRGETAANSTFVPLGFDGLFRVHNAVGRAPLIMDVCGSFELHSDALARRGDRQSRAGSTREPTRTAPSALRVERG